MTYPFTLSVVTPVLNGAEHLMKAMRSVREAVAQGASIEHIIVDGGSTDGTPELASSERDNPGSPITHILTGPDTGQAQAINRGFGVARGRYLGWLNADDYFLPQGLARLCEAMHRSDGDVILGRCSFVDGSGSVVFAPKPPDPVTPESLLRLLTGWFAGHSIVQPEAFIRSDAYRRVGGLDESLHYTMDHHLWVRLSLAGADFGHEPIDVARQLVHRGQKTADNAAVVAEMVGYALPLLRECPESPERSIAESELVRVRSRLDLARTITKALDGFWRSQTELRLMRDSGVRASDALLHRLRDISTRCPLVLLAGLKGTEIGRVAGKLSLHRPPTIAGRLPTSASAFDLVVVRAEALDGVPAGFDLRGILRPGGVLCLLGAMRAESVQYCIDRLRKALGDAITINSPGLLDVDDAQSIADRLRDASRNVVGVIIGDQHASEFLPDESQHRCALVELIRRLRLPPGSPLTGAVLLRTP